MDALTVFNDLSLTLGQPSANLPTEARARILSEINATLQILAGAPKAYFNQEDISISASASTASTTLSADVISIDRQVRHSDGEALVEVPTRSMFENYGTLYGGQTSRAITEGKPKAYFVEAKKAATAESGSDFTELEVFWWPTPDGSYTITANGRKRPAAITLASLSGTQQIFQFIATASAPDDNSYIVLNGSRGSLAIWFHADASEPAFDDEYLLGHSYWRGATERVYISTATWSGAAAGAALFVAAISPYYPECYLADTDSSSVLVHLGAYPFGACFAVIADSLIPFPTSPDISFPLLQRGIAPSAIPAPHGFIESVFMPIARFRLATFYRYFTDDQKLQHYAQQAQAALRSVGLDPDMAAFNADPQGRREEAIQA